MACISLQGERPNVFFSFLGTRELLVASTSSSSETKGKDGTAILDAKKGLLAVACHPRDSCTAYQALEDGSVSSVLFSPANRTVTSLWSISLGSLQTIRQVSSPQSA